mgnify:CR=1 FL=1
MSCPTMILFSGGEPVKQIVGAKPKAALLSDLADFLSWSAACLDGQWLGCSPRQATDYLGKRPVRRGRMTSSPHRGSFRAELK